MSVRKTSEAEALVKAFTDFPLNAAPEELQMPVARLWMLTAHLFPNPLPISSAMGLWCRDRGLAIEDAAKLLADMTHPAVLRQFRFAADLATYLADQCENLIRKAEDLRKRSTPAIDAPRLSGSAIQEALRKSGLVKVSKTPEED